MNYTELGQNILSLVGGKENVESLVHCATRLRFHLKDEKKADTEKIDQLQGVSGVISKSGQYQVIIGTEVGKVFNEIMKLGNGFSQETKSVTKTEEKKNIFMKIVDTFSTILVPLIPAFIAAGMIKAVLALLVLSGALNDQSQTYYVLNFIGDSAFYFMPILIANSAAKHFNVNPYLAMLLAGVLLHPNFTTAVSEGTSLQFMGFEIPLISYSSTIIPIILAVWIMSYLDKGLEFVIPKMFKFFLVPMLMVLIMAPIELMVLGPIGGLIGDGMTWLINVMSGSMSWLLIMILGAVFPLLLVAGAHTAFIPIILAALATQGYEMILLVGMLGVNLAQGGAALAVAAKTKNTELKQTALSTGITAVLGIVEPAMYSVNFRLKKPYIGVMAGGVAGALFAGIVGLKAYVFTTPGLISFPMWIGPDPKNMIFAAITMLIGFVVSFVVTYVIGFEDVKDKEDINETELIKEEKLLASAE